MKKTAKKWNLERDVQLNNEVTRTEWQEDRSQWKVTIVYEGKEREEYCDILISGQGFLK